jgi:hypothetical protein
MKITGVFAKYNLRTILALTIISVTWVNFNQERWLDKNVIVLDVVSYNSYLPALFYEHDLTLSFLYDDLDREVEARLYGPNHTPDGKPVIKMSMGMAVSYLPFFAVAHSVASLFDFPVNGFSEPYHFMLLFSSLAYFVIGLIYLWKVLIRFFSQQTAALTLFCITFATNTFYYLTIQGAYSHVVGFCFIAIFLHKTFEWYQNPKPTTALCLGLTLGFLMLVRPINVLIFIFFVFFGIVKPQDFKQRIRLFLAHKFNLLVIGISALLVVLPQLIYWKFITGHFFFNSYVGEHFFFNNPHILNALFGFRKGWLIYTPIMLFSLVGLFFFRKELRFHLLPISVFLAIYIYVTFSWWCWWYGGSFGQRVMIDIYPLLAIPFAAFVATVSKKGVLVKKLLTTSIVLFTALNLFQCIQAKYNIIHYDSMTKENYFEVFGTITKKQDREHYLKHPDYEKALKGEEEF